MADNNVDYPSHYTDGKIEVIDFIEDKNLNFHRGNAIKYIARAGKKNPNTEIEDLKKAIWYLNREIERLSKGVISGITIPNPGISVTVPYVVPSMPTKPMEATTTPCIVPCQSIEVTCEGGGITE